MTQENRFTWKLWAVSFTAWTLFTLSLTGTTYLWRRVAGFPASYVDIAALVFLNAWIDAALAPLVYIAVRRFPFERGNWAVRVPAHLAGMLTFTAVHMAIRMFIYPVRSPLTGLLSQPGWGLFGRMVLFGLHEEGVAAYLPIVALAQWMTMQQNAKRKEVQAEQLRRGLAEARLDALKLQLKPHFLFNTLNAVTELLHRDPRAAEEMLISLGSLLRFTMQSFEQNLISLDKELELVRAYIAIEQIRFAGRLTTRIDVESSCLQAQVPCMILQPIVENAIRHGIGTRHGLGTIALTVAHQGDALVVQIADDGPGLPPRFDPARAEGVGVRNTRERLEQLAPGRHEFRMQNREEGGVLVALKMPWVTQSTSNPQREVELEHA